MYDSVQHALLNRKFTGKERDRESGLDNFGTRGTDGAFPIFLVICPLASRTGSYLPLAGRRHSKLLSDPVRKRILQFGVFGLNFSPFPD